MGELRRRFEHEILLENPCSSRVREAPFATAKTIVPDTKPKSQKQRRPLSKAHKAKLAAALASWRATLKRSLVGRPVALASLDETLELRFVHAGHPFPTVLGRWTDPRVADNIGLAQCLHVRPILVDPGV